MVLQIPRWVHLWHVACASWGILLAQLGYQFFQERALELIACEDYVLFYCILNVSLIEKVKFQTIKFLLDLK